MVTLIAVNVEPIAIPTRHNGRNFGYVRLNDYREREGERVGQGKAGQGHHQRSGVICCAHSDRHVASCGIRVRVLRPVGVTFRRGQSTTVDRREREERKERERGERGKGGRVRRLLYAIFVMVIMSYKRYFDP